MWADEWSIVFAEIGDRNSLADKYGAVISAAVSDGMGTVTLGEALNPNFGIQTGTTWLYRTAQKALYQGNGGGRNFGVFNAKAKQIITLDISAEPTPTNATLRSTNGNVRVYEVTADGTVTFNLARYNYIYSISVTNPSATDVDYTLRYVDEEDNELKTSIKSGTPGESVSLLDADKENFWIGENKYIYVSDDVAGKTIAEDGSTVVTLTYRLATTRYSYTVKSNVGDIVFASASVLETESVTVPYPEHVLVGSTLYTVTPEKMTANDYYRVTFIPDHDNYEVVIPYDGTQIRDVVFYTEGEDIEGVSTATNDVRASKGQMGYTANADTYLPVTELRQGIYQIYIRGVNGNANARTVNFKAGDRIVYTDQISNGTEIRKNSDLVYIGETSTLSFACEGSSQSGLDNVYIVRIGDFEPTPVYTLNLRAENGAIANIPKTLSVRADNAQTYTWYESTTEDGQGTVVQSAKTAEEGGNRYTFTRAENAAVTYFYCIATGYSGVETKSVVTKITTVNENIPGVFVTGYNQDYEPGASVDWVSQNASVSIENHNGSNMLAINGENANGARTAYMPLTDNLRYMTPDHVTNDWGLEFDFYPVNNDFTPTDQALQIYKEGTIIGTTGQTAGNNMPLELNDCFITFDCNNTNNLYGISIAGVSQSGNITLTPGAKYHVSIKILESTMTRAAGGQMTVNIEDASGNPVYSYEGTSPFDTENLLGGIMYVMPRRNIKTAHAYFDNVTLKVMTTDLAINSDLPEFLEGNDDYYLNEGEGLNFDVPAATEFEWYVSSVMPEKGANGVDAPKLNDDGSVTWTNGTAFMTVQTPVDRATTTITKTCGVTTNSAEPGSKHAVEPTKSNEGKYAMQLKTQYPTVKTVWDEAGEFGGVKRYYPEATASGSRWHYLRQLDIEHAEADHLDYVWCVAKNPLGEVTSKIAQIEIYPMQPQIYLEDEYLTENVNGARADMTLPAIYKFRTHSVKIHAQNLIFNTPNLRVPYATKSIIHYMDEELHTYDPNTEVMGAGTQWIYNEDVWTGVISTTTFSGFDETLEQNASVHGFYKSIPQPLPVDFAYGLLQQQPGVDYHDIAKGTERNSIAEYVIGPRDNAALQATQDIHFDYGRYTKAEVQLQPVSTLTVWDWSKLPTRKFLTYNIQKHKDTNNDGIVDAKDETPKNIQAVAGTEYVVDPETGLGGPVMGTKYVMANFYGYGVEELGGFPSDKVKIGLEYVNNPTDQCMQGNAFVIKPALTGILDLSFSTTDSGESRYLTLSYDDKTVSYQAAGASDAFTKAQATNVRMTITSDMVDKEVKIQACKSSDNTSGQYFRIYTATYTPDAKPVEFTEWKVKDRAVGGEDEYLSVDPKTTKSDGFVSLTTTTEGATIKYKVLTGIEKDDAAITAFMNTDEYKNLEVHTYIKNVYEDPNDKNIKIGIHCPVNSTIFAWTESEGMNRSEVTWHKTNAAVYPVDMRFMKDFDTSTITSSDAFDNEYWGVAQSSLGSMTMDEIKNLSTTDAPKAWNATEFGKAYIDGVEYNADNFDKFFITHGTIIDIYINPESQYKFNGWGAPSFSGDKVVDMMRSGEKAKHVHYHLLYDKAKAATTAGIAFLIANFTDRTEDLAAKMMMKAGDKPEDTYNIDMQVLEGDKIIAPVYHSAHDADGMTVTHWTDDYSLETNDNFEDYTPGVEKQIYENTQIVPVYRDNTVEDNYRGRSEEMTATWWFTTNHDGHYAQPLTVKNEYPGFNMPYVTPVYRHQIGTATEGAADDLWFDFPMTITPTATGRLDNTVVPDWCSVGRGITFTMPACPGAVVQMEVRTRLSDAETGTKFGGETPTLCKVKYKGDADYTEITDLNQLEASKTVDSYVYKATYTGNAETLDVVIGSDYSYIRNISLTLPPIVSRRDAALVTLDFSELYQHLDMVSLATNNFTEKKSPKQYLDGSTGCGYQFDHMSENASLYKTHYSKEDGAIYYDGVSRFMAVPNQGMEVPDNVPYVNGILGYTYSTGTPTQGTKISDNGRGTFIVGPFRSITHIRYKQGSSRLGGGGWYMTVGRKTMNWNKSLIQQDDMINKADDPRRQIPDFSQVQWSDAKYGSIHNSTTPEWVEMDIEEHIYPDGKDNTDVSLIEADDFDTKDGNIWLRFQADNPDVYLFAIEIYGIDPTSDQQVTLETNVMVAENDDATQYEPTFIAGDIFHFPYLLRLDDSYKPESNLKDTENKIMQFNEGREVTLTANPNTGFDFLKWVKADASGNWKEVSRENPYKFNINENSQIRAVFVPRGIINYTAQGTRFGLVPEPVQANGQGGFTVAENRSLFAAEGQSLRYWQDTDPQHEWYSGAGTGVSSCFAVSTNTVNGSTATDIERSRAAQGVQVDVTPEFTDNTLSLLDVVGRIGATARWQFGKKNGAPTMEGHGTTPRLVTQVSVTGTKDVLNPEDNSVSSETVIDLIDVNMEMHANVNNAGRADAYATVDNDATFTLPCTKGMKVEIGTSTGIQYSLDGGTNWADYTEAFHIYKRDAAVTLQLRNATDTGDDGTMELEYIQATYHQRAQKPVLSMQSVDVVGDHATNNVQVQVQTNSNPTAVRFYTLDGSDPQYEVVGNTVHPVGSTRQVRGNYITINETQIGSGTTLKVLSVCSDRADSEIATLDLEQYDKDLGLATYVYDSRIINIHEDQIFQKLMAEHEGHFNLLSYDLNPAAAVIPSVILNNTTVFVTSDAVREHLLTALTTPSDPAAHGQSFTVKPLIVGTPLRVSWKQNASEGEWQDVTWVAQDSEGKPVATVNPATPTSPATITYTEWLRSMKKAVIRDDQEDDDPATSRKYSDYYADQIAAAGGKYILAFYDGMLLDGSKLCISTTTDNAPEHLSANGTQLVFNATELLTRITEVGGVKTPADVSTFNNMILALMAPSKNPQLIDVKMSYTEEVIDYKPDAQGWISMDAPMLSALSDGLSVMSMPYLSKTYPQFVASTIEGKGQVTITNVETYNPERDNIATAEKLGAQGIKDLATIITVSNTSAEVTAGLDPSFKREYRIDYNIALDSLTFYKKGDQWICDENDICTITESKNANDEPLFKLLGPINSGIKDVCFNGYAVAPNDKFDPATGELRPDEEGQHNYTVWGQGEKFDDDAMRSPTAYDVTGFFIPEYPESSDPSERSPLSGDQWMEAHFPWGFKDSHQMAFTLLNITDYVGDIKVRFYRKQADAPEIVKTNIKDDMKVPANGEFTLQFNSVMHDVRLPGKYDDMTVTWTAHIIPDELGGGIKYGDIKGDNRQIDQYDTDARQILLSAQGGSNTLTFQYWHLEEGKKYWLHIPLHILRGYVGEGTPYEYPANLADRNDYEKLMSVTNYVGTDSKAVPYFDIPFTVKETKYNHMAFNYIVNNDNWWDAYKEKGKAAPSLPSYAKWDGGFTAGIKAINDNADKDDKRFYMHVQKQKDGGTYNLGTSLLQIQANNFSIVGEGQDSTIVTANPDPYTDSDYRGLREDVTGNQTATLHLDANNVYMQGITLENKQKGLPQDGQEYPALFNHGNRNTFYDVNIDGYEESFASFGTLSYLERCKISGYGDFIVGGGDVWFEQCKILLRDKAMINLCAPATKATEKWGFVFNDCHLDREENATQVNDHSWTLARPWGGYDEAEVLKSPAVTFLKTKLTVLPTNTGYGALTEGLRLRFHEYGTYKNNPDNPAPLSMRSVANCAPTADSDYPVLTKEEAAEYTIANVFGRDNDGYDPQALTKQAQAPVLANDGMVLHWKANKEDLCYLVYYLGDGEKPDWQNAMMFCCVPGTDEKQAYCYLTNHDISPIFRTGGTDKPISFSELWYGKRKVNGSDEAYNDNDIIPGMGKDSPSRLWFAVRAANQMGGLSEMSNALMYHAARQYRTTIKIGGVLKGDDSGNAYSTIYLDFQALAPKGVKAYALTDVSSSAGEGTAATTLTFTRVSESDDENHQDVVYADQGYLIYGPYGKTEGKTEMNHVFIETTTPPDTVLTSHFSGTVGEFNPQGTKDGQPYISEQGYGEMPDESMDGHGWSIAPKDYDNVSKGNINAFTLQSYNDLLGFYKFTGTEFAHHRAYLDADKAAELLMESEGMTKDEAEEHLVKGLRFVIREPDGTETEISSVFMDEDTKDGIYDLEGRRLSSRKQLKPGHIYIIDGQKVMWKR